MTDKDLTQSRRKLAARRSHGFRSDDDCLWFVFFRARYDSQNDHESRRAGSTEH